MILEQVRESERKRQSSQLETFESLSRQVADDAPLDPDVVAEQLEELGRTAEELSDAAELIVSRREWSAQLVQDADLHAEHNRLAAEMTAIIGERDAAIHAARVKADQATARINQRLATVDSERDKAQTARNRLTETSVHHDRLRKLWAEHGAAIYALQGRLAVELRQAAPMNLANVKREIARTEAKAEQLAAEIARLEREALIP